MKTLFSYFQQFSLPKIRKTCLLADFVTNNQILIVKIIKIRPPLLFRPPRLLDFMNISVPPPPYLLRPPVYSRPKNKTQKRARDERDESAKICKARRCAKHVSSEGPRARKTQKRVRHVI